MPVRAMMTHDTFTSLAARLPPVGATRTSTSRASARPRDEPAASLSPVDSDEDADVDDAEEEAERVIIALEKPPTARSDKDLACVRRATSGVKFFRSLNDTSLHLELCRVMTTVIIPKDHHVIEQGTEGTEFFIIFGGSVKVHVDDGRNQDLRGLGTCVAELQDGDSFGELALLGNGQRAATVVTATDTRFFKVMEDLTLSALWTGTACQPPALCPAATTPTPKFATRPVLSSPFPPPCQAHFLSFGHPHPRTWLLQVDKEAYDSSLARAHQAELQQRVDFFQRIFLFTDWKESALKSLSKVVTPKKYEKNTTIIRQYKNTDQVDTALRTRVAKRSHT